MILGNHDALRPQDLNVSEKEKKRLLKKSADTGVIIILQKCSQYQ